MKNLFIYCEYVIIHLFYNLIQRSIWNYTAVGTLKGMLGLQVFSGGLKYGLLLPLFFKRYVKVEEGSSLFNLLR